MKYIVRRLLFNGNKFKVIFPLDESLRRKYNLHCIKDRYVGWVSSKNDPDQPDFVHTMKHLLPKNKYSKYWINNQVDINNHETADIICENLKKKMDEFPKIKYWSVSLEDNKEKLFTSDDLVRFINSIAKRFPDKIISTLAYFSTEDPPKMEVPDSNVEIMLTTINLPKDKPIRTNNRNDVREWRSKLKQWKHVCDINGARLLIWDYVVNFKHLIMPYPNLHTLGDNLRFFSKYSDSYIIQLDYGVGHEFVELKSYLLAKLLHNPFRDDSRLLDDYLVKVYKENTHVIKQYIDLLRQEQSKGKWLINWADPSEFTNSYLSKENLDTYYKLLSIDNDDVRVVKLQILYTMIVLNIASKDQIAEYKDICEKLGNVTINETNDNWRSIL